MINNWFKAIYILKNFNCSKQTDVYKDSIIRIDYIGIGTVRRLWAVVTPEIWFYRLYNRYKNVKSNYHLVINKIAYQLSVIYQIKWTLSSLSVGLYQLYLFSDNITIIQFVWTIQIWKYDLWITDWVSVAHWVPIEFQLFIPGACLRATLTKRERIQELAVRNWSDLIRSMSVWLIN